MRYTVSIVPPGGGEVDWSFDVIDGVHVPRVGEYISVAVDSDNADQAGLETFLVRRVVAELARDKDGVSRAMSTTVEVEPLRHPMQSKSHAGMCDRYDGHWGSPTQNYPTTGY